MNWTMIASPAGLGAGLERHYDPNAGLNDDTITYRMVAGTMEWSDTPGVISPSASPRTKKGCLTFSVVVEGSP